MENALAYMQPDASNPLKFDVYLNKNKYKIENVRSINQFKQNLIKRTFEKNSKYDKKTTKNLVNNYIKDENNYLQLVKIITLITDCGHEIHHILQYLKKYSKANKNNKTEYLDDGYELDLKVYNSLTDRELKNYYKILDMISEIELTADSHSYEYFYNLLDALSYLNPGDISYNQFLNTCLQISEEERIERKTQNKYAFKELKTLKKRVKNKYGLDLI